MKMLIIFPNISLSKHITQIREENFILAVVLKVHVIKVELTMKNSSITFLIFIVCVCLCVYFKW